MMAKVTIGFWDSIAGAGAGAGTAAADLMKTRFTFLSGVTRFLSLAGEMIRPVMNSPQVHDYSSRQEHSCSHPSPFLF